MTPGVACIPECLADTGGGSLEAFIMRCKTFFKYFQPSELTIQCPLLARGAKHKCLLGVSGPYKEWRRFRFDTINLTHLSPTAKCLNTPCALVPSLSPLPTPKLQFVSAG